MSDPNMYFFYRGRPGPVFFRCKARICIFSQVRSEFPFFSQVQKRLWIRIFPQRSDLDLHFHGDRIWICIFIEIRSGFAFLQRSDPDLHISRGQFRIRLFQEVEIGSAYLKRSDLHNSRGRIRIRIIQDFKDPPVHDAAPQD